MLSFSHSKPAVDLKEGWQDVSFQFKKQQMYQVLGNLLLCLNIKLHKNKTCLFLVWIYPAWAPSHRSVAFLWTFAWQKSLPWLSTHGQQSNHSLFVRRSRLGFSLSLSSLFYRAHIIPVALPLSPSSLPTSFLRYEIPGLHTMLFLLVFIISLLRQPEIALALLRIRSTAQDQPVIDKIMKLSSCFSPWCVGSRGFLSPSVGFTPCSR